MKFREIPSSAEALVSFLFLFLVSHLWFKMKIVLFPLPAYGLMKMSLEIINLITERKGAYLKWKYHIIGAHNCVKWIVTHYNLESIFLFI